MLLPYHLGVARVLRDSSSSLPIRAAAGSSSGAIAAALFTMAPHRLEEYRDRFLSDDGGGHGLTLIRHVLETESLSTAQQHGTATQLSVCTTKCVDGSMHLFRFDSRNDLVHPNLIPAVLASCTIPRSFHPYDLFSRQRLSYPDGVEIDGELYCDGGISAPAPPAVPLEKNVDTTNHIVVSPISGPVAGGFCIRPTDTSFGLPFTMTTRCDSFQVRPSLQNLKALFGSLGATSASVLRDWCSRGEDDANDFLESVNGNYQINVAENGS
jgi:predicted acylesterase/phospholipase RssA